MACPLPPLPKGTSPDFIGIATRRDPCTTRDWVTDKASEAIQY